MPDAPAGGRTGRVMGRVHSVCHDRLTELREQARRAHNAIQGKTQRQWQIPSTLTGSILNVPQLHEPAFNRDEINANYAEATRDPGNPGTVGDVIGLKLQIDYIACEERAFRARHTTLCRAFCLANGRRYGQGWGNVWDPKNGVEAAIAAFFAAGGVK